LSPPTFVAISQIMFLESFPLPEILHGLRFHPEYNAAVQPWLMFSSSVLYLAVIYLLRRWMAHRSPFSCITVMRLHNAIQIGVCSYMSIGLVGVLWRSGPLHFGSVQIPNVFGFGQEQTAAGEYYVFLHYLSKYLDFFDTIFIVLKKKDKQLSFLHLYHHATIGPIWGALLFVGWGSGTPMFGALLNSIVHVLMYSHYLAASFKIKNPFKAVLTGIQITQFYVCILHAVLAVGLPADVVNYPRSLSIWQVFYHISMIILFTQFFQKSYRAGGSSGGRGSGGGVDASSGKKDT